MRSFIVIACLVGTLLIAGPRAAESQEPAQGFVLWVRSPVGALQNLFGSISAPQFNVGFRGDRFGLGLGPGFTVLRSTEKNVFNGQLGSKETFNATLFQIGPSGWVDVWHSPDGRTRGNIAAGVSIGRLSGTDKDEFRRFDGAIETSESSVSATLMGFHVGLGGEHFLHPHFALGVEGGFQGNVAFDLKEKGDNDTLGLWANGLYGALRMMIVF
ncbi:MAG: hypothetical protein HY710_03980 [Candidatus Latescibacteria bacterium]|nr:hypothetical protein [Candidatus Latescibacterota bacterium]